MFLNLEIENFNERADTCLRTVSQSGSIHYRRKAFCLGPGNRCTPVLFIGHPTDTSLRTQSCANHILGKKRGGVMASLYKW